MMGNVGGVLAGVVPGAGVGTTVAKYTGATAALKQVTGAAQNTSWLLVILGIVHYILRIRFGFSSGLAITLVFSLTLCFVGVYALAAKLEKDRYAIMIPTFVFLVWYFIFGANYDPGFLIYFLSVVGVIFVLPAIFTKGESIPAEFTGLIPVLFLFLDIGLIPFLIEKLSWPITPLVENLVLYMPWWAFLGLLTLPSEASKSGSVNFLVSATKVIGILYIVFIVVAPAVPTLGYDQSLIPTAAEFEESQARFREKLPQKENPGWSNLKCILDGRYSDIQVCVQERQENSEIEAVCKKEGYEKNSFSFDECIKEKKEERKEEAYSASGIYTSSVREPTTVEIKINSEQLVPEYNPQWGYSAEVIIKNPGKQKIKAEVICDLTSAKDKKTFPGLVDPVTIDDFSEEDFGETFICFPEKGVQLNGTYTLNFSLKMKGLETKSYLQRAFIGKKSGEDKEKALAEIKTAKVFKESFSAKEFARINFFLGHTKDNVVIEDKMPMPILMLTLENLGSGKITAVESYSLDFGPKSSEFKFHGPDEESGESYSCKTGQINDFDTTKKVITFRQCRLDDYPYKELANDQWERVTFEADLKYDYLISKNVQVSPDPTKIIK
jgi:hypothetical protein